jgi:hypothetical protein
LIFGVKSDLSEGGFDAHKYFLTTCKPESAVKIQSVNPNSPQCFETLELKHWVLLHNSAVFDHINEETIVIKERLKQNNDTVSASSARQTRSLSGACRF